MRGTDQFKIDRVRGIHVQIEIYCWGYQQGFDILDIEKNVWFSPNINIVAYSRVLLYWAR